MYSEFSGNSPVRAQVGTVCAIIYADAQWRECPVFKNVLLCLCGEIGFKL